MPYSISNSLFLSFVLCRYKAYLKLSGQQGSKPDFAELLDDEAASYRRLAQQHFHNRYKTIAGGETTSEFKDVKKQRLTTALNVSISTGNYDIILDAVQLSLRASVNKPIYYPILFLPHSIPTKYDHILLAFHGLLLSDAQKLNATIGKFLFGDNFRTRTVPLAVLITTVNRIQKDLCVMIETRAMPPLILNDHCKICEFYQTCLSTAKKADDLSLLTSLREKDITKLHNKGVFTVTQYSYCFKPRRKRKRAKHYVKKHLPDLQALSIRNSTIYVYERPSLPEQNRRIYIDVEGDPFEDYYYLIGVLIADEIGIKQHSFWADDKSHETAIFEQLYGLLSSNTDFLLYHYGKYEMKVFRKLQRQLAKYGTTNLQNLFHKTLNVRSCIYGNIYFPTYSNTLKDIAGYFGFRWSSENASGLQSVVWRKEWEQSQNNALKDRLIQYNQEDCLALKIVTQAIYKISANEPSTINSVENTKYVNDLKSEDELEHRKWQRPTFCLPDLSYINSCAYFDYQKRKVFFRTSKTISQTLNREKKQQKPSVRINKVFRIRRPRKCDRCGNTEFFTARHFTKKVFDVKFLKDGIRRWVTKYTGVDFYCVQCHGHYSRKKHRYPQSKYGRSLICWIVYLNIANGMSGGQIKRLMEDIFHLPISANLMSDRFRSEMAVYHISTYKGILKKIICGKLAFVDETPVSFRDGSGYVWIFANMEERYYFFTETREMEFSKKLLNEFHGVLVSDFFAGYNSFLCAQQKCLIHLIRDLNNSFFTNQFDVEFKELIQSFTVLLRNIIDTIDKWGLKKWHLNKHRKEVKRVFSEISRNEYSSDLAKTFQKRFMKNESVLFTFLEHDGVPWNNNNAEHAIKAFADFRKKIGFSFSKASLGEFLLLLSISETCKAKGIDFLRFLCSGRRDLEQFQIAK